MICGDSFPLDQRRNLCLPCSSSQQERSRRQQSAFREVITTRITCLKRTSIELPRTRRAIRRTRVRCRAHRSIDTDQLKAFCMAIRNPIRPASVSLCARISNRSRRHTSPSSKVNITTRLSLSDCQQQGARARARACVCMKCLSGNFTSVCPNRIE